MLTSALGGWQREIADVVIICRCGACMAEYPAFQAVHGWSELSPQLSPWHLSYCIPLKVRQH